ncbi:PRC-barrel domain-containing protein [Gilvimarinus sp. F26214L]|uniref:PRC-barrel domain-containing protein n=1 Tax=Gilvimarinus sp. DZF01 TaxID=3461371 RepID=UPI004045FB94
MNSASQLMHAPVCTGSGELIGHVDDMLVNPISGRVDYVSVRPYVEEGSICVRLSWRDMRLDQRSQGLVVVPGSTAVKRLLIRAGLNGGPDAIH